jgi:DNA-binding SARP family transcriptional activator/tetratricopeptide (TPR) repeat protein
MMAKGVAFHILGPVRVLSADRPADIGERKQRLVLAMLALDINKVVPLSRLADALWGGSPPNSARRTIQAHISRLRTALNGAGITADGAALIRHGSGYLLAADPACVDAHRFRFMVEDARLRADDPGKVQVLSEALALWHGPALADAAPDDVRQQLCGGLEETRLMAVEDLLDAELRLGHHLEIIDELSSLAALHPYRPRITACIMLALYRAGRTADALSTFELLRRRLRGELGLDPSAELTELHVAILRADPGLSLGQVSLAGPSPAQLPAGIADFAGRAAELASLSRLVLGRGDGDDAIPPAIVITGGAGVGKTALAVHWAHLMAGQFPGGQLYLNLRGYSDTAPVSALDALTGLLRGLGGPAMRIPADEGQAAALYRSEMASRRMIVVLDNARGPEHVRPLLTGRSRSVTLVTSRSGLIGLTAREGTARIILNPLSNDEALTLLTGMIGADRVSREAGATTELARLCAGLPLALRVAAARLQTVPHTPISEYVKEIADEDGFAALQVDDDESASVWAAFELSYLALDPAARRVFRLLGVMASGSLAVPAIAAMSGAPPAHIRRTLERLVDAHLVEQRSGARFGPHDLLRRYASLKSKTEDTAADAQAALQRLLRWYCDGADRAIRLVCPYALRQLPSASNEGHQPEFTHGDDALAWLERERPNLVAAVLRAAGEEETVVLGLATQLARRLHPFLFTRGHLSNDIQVNHAARMAARRIGDVAAEAWACTALGTASNLQGQVNQALTWHYRALEIARGTGDAYLVATCLSNTVDAWWRLGEADRCETALREEMALRVGLADSYGQAFCQLNLAELHRRKGLYGQARIFYEDSLHRSREVGDRYGEALALNGLGCLDLREGQLMGAARSLSDAAAILREIANRSALGYMLVDLGQVYRRQGQSEEALSCLREALRLCQELGLRRREAECLRELSISPGELVPSTPTAIGDNH